MGYEKVSKKEMIKIRKEFCDDLGDFDRRFFDNLDLLIGRINKLKTLKPGTIDYWTYYDMVLTQIRAMLIETTGRKHYTN